MPEFETLHKDIIEFKNGGEFLELSVGVVRDGGRETKYLRLTRGYYDGNGEPRYKKNSGVTLPGDAEVLKQLGALIGTYDLSRLAAGAKGPSEAPTS